MNVNIGRVGETYYSDGDTQVHINIPSGSEFRQQLIQIADKNDITTKRTFAGTIRYLLQKGIEEELKE